MEDLNSDQRRIAELEAMVARLLKVGAALRGENRELWDQVELATPSVKRDYARCRAAGENDEKSRYRRWLDKNDNLRERYPKP